MKIRTAAFAGLALATLAGCKTQGDLVVDEGVGITALRTACPAVGIPDYTGDVTLFSPAGSVTSDAIDVTASMTDVRSTCDESGERIYAQASFIVFAQRRNTSGARTVQLPYFASVIRGGNAVVSKRIGTVTLEFPDGQARASATGSGGAFIDKAEATLPDDIRERITRKRKAGQADAAVDPLADPAVRAAVSRASFELLVGFQLTQDQLGYNVTR
ncbi:hypothetical protein GRI89_00745 [Altererythrobacter salegens]|uniref:Lipoprotein n=1 Tax=Croceibacterium salegens TaxID=1737568 RepID=A0A6I4SQE0_9SPHN|nr:hypothetical protein [Croceibacterium salegens]MXO58073.1 hypothetical protein [Croceibacterium salegens]